MIRKEIMDAFIQCVDGNTDSSFIMKTKSDNRVRREALLLAKSVEGFLERLCEMDLESLTVQELYNEISGQAHLG